MLASTDPASRQESIPPLDLGVQLAANEVADLVQQLEPTLTTHQRSLLHQVRLAAESLGAARAALLTRLRDVPSRTSGPPTEGSKP